jgi:hypothetical protein
VCIGFFNEEKMTLNKKNEMGSRYLKSNKLSHPNHSRRSKHLHSEVFTFGHCVCPECRMKIPHLYGRSCFKQCCPLCGSALMRAMH